MTPIPVSDGDLFSPFEVLSYESYKAYLGGQIDDSEQQSIEEAIVSAVRDLEGHTGRSFSPRDYDIKLNKWEAVIYLPGSPAISLEWVKYLDTADAEQTLTENADFKIYGLNQEGLNGRGRFGAYIIPIDGWPDLSTDDEAIRIRWKAGYADPLAIPGQAILAAQIRTGMYYSFKGNEYDSDTEDHYFNTILPLMANTLV